MEKNIQKQLKSDYEDLEIKPSADLWSRIEVEIDGKIIAAQKTTFQWWKYAAVVILVISFGAVFFFDNDAGNKKELTKAVIIDKAEKLNIINEESIPIAENLVKAETHNVDSRLNSIKKEENLKQTISANPQNISEHIFVEEKLQENENIQIQIAQEADNSLNQKPTIAERKKVNYTNAEQLLLGRELDKTREENLNEQRKFGVLDIRKIKGPHSFKILGFTVYSDSLQTR